MSDSVLLVNLKYEIEQFKAQGGRVLRSARVIGETLAVLQKARGNDDLTWLEDVGLTPVDFAAFVQSIGNGKIMIGEGGENGDQS